MKLTTAFRITGALALILATPATADTSELVAQGEKVFTNVCFECHNATAPNPDMVAPPIFAAKNHYGNFTDRADFVAAVSSYVRNPTEATARMPGAINKFGLMPAHEIAEAEAVAVAEYLFATDFSLPDWYKVHYEEEHGEAPAGN